MTAGSRILIRKTGIRPNDVGIMNHNNIVLLLKASTDGYSDPYVECLREAGFQSNYISPLAFRFINVDSLREAMHLAEQFSCLVLTSQRSVDAIKNAFPAALAAEWTDILCHVWCSKPIFAVGKSTSAAASALGLVTRGSEAGNAENLSTLIISELQSLVEQGTISPNAKVLLLCGQLSLDTVPQRLTEAGIQTERLTVYETVADDSLANNLQTFTSQQGTPGYIVFFSPSIVRFSQNILMKTGCLQPNTRVIAIGPTTAAEMTRTLGRVDGMAALPDPQHVCHNVKSLCSQNGT